MKLPNNCVNFECEEMRYIEAGGNKLYPANGALPMVPGYYKNKSKCLFAATHYAGVVLSDGNSYGRTRLAQEIYAHAFLYYVGSVSQSVCAKVRAQTGYSSAIVNSALNYIVSHSNPINLGGDNSIRVACYSAIWKLF